MREYLDANDIANSAMMAGASGKTVVIVEGVTDRRLYGKFMDPSVTVVIAHSKSNVVGAIIQTSKRRKCEYVIGIADADLDYINHSIRPGNLFLTDTRDSETLMFKSSAYDDVVSEYYDMEKSESFEKRYGGIRERLIKSSYPVGILMYLSEKNGWKLCFKDLDFETFIDRRTIDIDIRGLVSALTENPNYAVKRKEILKSLEEELLIERDPWHVCRGHDLMKIMAIGLREAFGSWNSKHISDSALSGAFRLAFDNSDFVQTKLFAESEEWSRKTGRKLWKINQA